MRKDNGVKKGKGIKALSGVLIYYEVKGYNVGSLLSAIVKSGVTVYDVKRKNAKTVTFAIKPTDSQKLFAITGGVWYNTYKVRKIRYGDRYFLFRLLKNAGLIIGIALFCLSSYLFGDVILDFSFTGSGSGYKREITEYLAKNNVTRFSRFSAIDLKSLSGGILAHNDGLSFVSCYKSGNRLIISSAIAYSFSDKLSGKAENLASSVSGEIFSVKVYRGRALLSAGDKVNKGDVIVSGDVVIKDKQVKVNVIATAIVIYAETYRFELTEKNENAAIAAACETANKTPCGSEVTFSKIGEKYIYEIKLFFKKIINVG